MARLWRRVGTTARLFCGTRALEKEKRRLKGHTDTVWSLAFLESGLTLASTGEDGTVRLWSLVTGEDRILVRRPNRFSSLKVWQDQALAFGGWDDYVYRAVGSA